METIINKIESLEGIRVLHEIVKQAKANGNIWDVCDMEIYEESTGITWVNDAGYNNNPWDFWLKKKGTLGCQNRTFIRISVGKDLNEHLRFGKEIMNYS